MRFCFNTVSVSNVNEICETGCKMSPWLTLRNPPLERLTAAADRVIMRHIAIRAVGPSREAHAEILRTADELTQASP